MPSRLFHNLSTLRFEEDGDREPLPPSYVVVPSQSLEVFVAMNAKSSECVARLTATHLASRTLSVRPCFEVCSGVPPRTFDPSPATHLAPRKFDDPWTTLSMSLGNHPIETGDATYIVFVAVVPHLSYLAHNHEST